MESPVTCLVSRHCFLCLGLGLVLIFVCQSLSCFHVSSWLVSYNCVLIVSLSVVAQFLFCVETLAFVADSWSMYLFTCWSLTYCKRYHALAVSLSFKHFNGNYSLNTLLQYFVKYLHNKLATVQNKVYSFKFEMCWYVVVESTGDTIFFWKVGTRVSERCHHVSSERWKPERDTALWY